MTAPKPHRVIVALKPARAAGALIAQAKGVLAAMTSNAYFPAPNPPLKTFAAHIAALEAAELTALTRVKGAVEARDAAALVVLEDLLALKALVQQVANAKPLDATEVIVSATMNIKKVNPAGKRLFEVKQGALSGSVELAARAAARRAFYEWQMSTDQKTWVDLPSTLQTRTSVAGLPVATHYFRFRAVTKDGPGEWSQIISLMVV